MTATRTHSNNRLSKKSFRCARLLCVALLLSCFCSVAKAITPEPMPSFPIPFDDTKYAPYSYIRIIGDKDTIDFSKITDEQFFDLAGKVIFPINKYTLPTLDSLVMELKNQVLPLINKDSLQLVKMMLRGAASPEGPTHWNKFLGEKRAEALMQFLGENLVLPTDSDFNMEINIEDYRTLCVLMHRRGDKDYGYVQALCDQYLPKNQTAKLKTTLRNARQGTLWLRLFREYFPMLRAARIILFFKHTRPVAEEPEMTIDLNQGKRVDNRTGSAARTVGPQIVVPKEPEYDTLTIKRPRREWLSVKSNLLFDFAYVPGYNRWCPIPNVAIEFYPKHGHFTYGFSLDFPWWQHYHQYKHFQIRNYQFETRYYVRSGDIRKREPGKGAAFRGLYFNAYVHTGLFGISFSDNKGWEGEGLGGGLGVGYVIPLGRKGHWRLELGAQAGFFTAKYDPYQYGNPLTGEIDDLYYYKWTGTDPTQFKKRQYRFNWIGPTRVDITLSYDLLYRRIAKKGISFIPWEKAEVIQPRDSETTDETYYETE